MSIVKTLGIPQAPQGAQRLKPMDGAALKVRADAIREDFGKTPAPGRVLPASQPALAPPARQVETQVAARAAPQADEPPASGVDEARRLFTRQTLSAYAAVLAGEETAAAYGAGGARAGGAAQDGPPKPPGSVLDISA